MKPVITPAQRRRFDRFQAVVDRVTAADAKFFERFPARSFRVRLASSAELEQNAIVEGRPVAVPPPGYRFYTIVKQLAPGVRLRVQAQGPEGADLDISDAMVREVYDEVVRPGGHFARVEAQMRAALARMGARH